MNTEEADEATGVSVVDDAGDVGMLTTGEVSIVCEIMKIEVEGRLD